MIFAQRADCHAAAGNGIGAQYFLFHPANITAFILLLFAAAAFAVFLCATAAALKNAYFLKRKTQAFFPRNHTSSRKKQTDGKSKKRGMRLQYKLFISIAALAFLSILCASVPLYCILKSSQKNVLTEKFEETMHAALQSLMPAARAYLSEESVPISALPEAVDKSASIQSAAVMEISEFGFIVRQTIIPIHDYSGGKKNDTHNSAQTALRVQKEQEEVQQADSAWTHIAKQCREISESAAAPEFFQPEIYSYPEFRTDAKHLRRNLSEYLFYAPLVCRSNANSSLIYGAAIIKVSAQMLRAELAETDKAVFSETAKITLAAFFAGLLFSLLLSSVIAHPVKKLAAHTTRLRSSETKKGLKNIPDAVIESRDEIGELCGNINIMARRLIKAAGSSEMLSAGKEVQRTFLPLDTTDAANGTKISTGREETAGARFFAYYEGAQGVSGDYFDYKNLDNRRYALIKCDVSGKGPPAALIAAEVAALFCDYFAAPSVQKGGIDLPRLAYKINDQLYKRNFKGRFAAFTLAVFDMQSGDISLCNAGDNIIHIYDASEYEYKTFILPQAPAAGPFDSKSVKNHGGYQTCTVHLDAGDTLFLYTDGIESSKRLYRNAAGEALHTPPQTNGAADGGKNKSADDGEELSAARIRDIIDAVFSKSRYELKKKASPQRYSPHTCVFDFSTCEATPENAVLALAAAEKIFRMRQDSNAAEYDCIQIDKKLDAFLSRHFVQYNRYFSHKKALSESAAKSGYELYTHIQEEEQTDDITIIAVQKKAAGTAQYSDSRNCPRT
ncbi:MAG: SpoIIE family protein phosphatase [Bacteroides sp.]|nr:SpoIIE family protein phosphatase [Prevotella sp.]MCM1407003.1 SpoIIE family protein phosphatase [Treponema brennaborense]MCM1470154.1 SpoIIE family protein phosphatase [Bacteroides sp.]